VGEIKKLAKAKVITAADGAILLAESIWPALESVDSSSGALATSLLIWGGLLRHDPFNIAVAVNHVKNQHVHLINAIDDDILTHRKASQSEPQFQDCRFL
jgi:hypothetical protein